MASLGELFVKLGFDVDDTKLKSFQDSIENVFSGIQKLAGYAGVGLGIAGFVELAKGASDTALTVENLTRVYGVSEKAIRDWAAAVHENNPLKDFNAGVSSFATFSEYLKNAAFTPQGAMALNLLGVQYSSADLQHPEKMLNKLFDTVPTLLKEHPDRRSFYSQQIATLTGDAANIGVFERGPAWAAAAAARAATSEADNSRMTAERRQIAALQDEWDKFVNHATGTLAGGVLNLQGQIEKAQKTNPGAAGFFEGIWEWAKTDPYNLPGLGQSLIHNSIMDKAVSKTSDFIQGSVSKGNALGMIRKLGWSDDQASGIVRRLMIESGLDPGQYGHGKEARGMPDEAYGIAQWHPDRQKEFSRVMGRDIHGSSLEEQIAFMNYELTKGNERTAGNALRQTKNADDAYATFTNKYERPAVTVNVTQNIHSTDPDQAGQAAARAIQETITPAYLNRLQEPY